MTKSYTTISGDMWDKIAFEQMGSALHTDKLMKANVKYASTYVFPAVVVLTIPEVEDEEDLELPRSPLHFPWEQSGCMIKPEGRNYYGKNGSSIC